jgi:hypothetical protein
MEFMPEHAPMVVMAFLGTLALLGLLALILVFAIWTRKKWIGIGAVVFGLALVSCYALVLMGVSLTSHEKVLAPGEHKYFCEIDCHIAYSIAGVEESSTLGNELHPTAAVGRFVIVHLKTWFDPSTISPHRGNGQLSPNPRRVVLVDKEGHEFAPSAAAQTALEKLHGTTTPISQPLRPGESYVTDTVFDVPPNLHNLRFFIGDNVGFPDTVLIGHEDSYLHRKIYLALAAADTISAGRVPR